MIMYTRTGDTKALSWSGHARVGSGVRSVPSQGIAGVGGIDMIEGDSGPSVSRPTRVTLEELNAEIGCRK